MTWFKVDDQLAFHSKVLTAGNAAMGLWVRAGAWSAAHLTDGFIPNHVVMLLCAGNSAEIEALVAANLWLPRDGGYQFHDWGDQQPSSHDVKERRRKEAERKAAARARKRDKDSQENEGVRDVSHPDTGSERTSPPELTLVPMEQVSQGESQGSSPRPSALPDPTRPDPTRTTGGHPGEGGAGGNAPRKRSASTKKGTRLDPEWEPDAELRQWVYEKCPNVKTKQQFEDITENFKAHWLSKPGKDAEKLDWKLTYQKWMRTENSRLPGASHLGRAGVASPPRRSTTDDRAAQVEALRRRPASPHRDEQVIIEHTEAPRGLGRRR